MSGESTTISMGISDKLDLNDAKETDIESQILSAMRARVTYLREKADSFTFESVRRLLEEDLKMEKYALDVHKSFVKQHLVECLEEGAENNGTSENSQEIEKKDDVTPGKEEAKLSKDHKAEKDKDGTTGDDEKMEDSPVMGLLTEENTSKSVAEDSKEVLQSNIKKALRKRSSYIKANSEKITMGLLRRLLEQDLKLEKYSLDPYKKFINDELDEVLQAPDATKPSTEAKKKNLTKKVKSTSAKKLGSEEENSDSDGEDEEDDEEVAVKKKTAQKRKLSKSEGTGKRKREKEKLASAKKTKQADSQRDSDVGENASTSEKPVKKQESATPGYGKRVEHLKSVIKSCGMSVPPYVYRKAKQAPEEKREDTLIKELKEILAKEGLSSNPSEKEIKEVKKRKERTKELEGIDTSNIVSSSRRRSSASFVPPPTEKIEESESDESEDSEDEEEEGEEEEEVEGEVEEEEEEEEGEEEDEEEGSQKEGEPNTEDGGEEESE